MASIDYSALSINELKDIIKSAEKAISEKENEARRTAISRATEIAREAGYSSLEEMMSNAPKATRKSTASAPKYRHPENPETTWTGRGRQPGWYAEALANGAKEEDLLIK